MYGWFCFSHEEQKGVLGSSHRTLKDVLEQLRELNGDQDYGSSLDEPVSIRTMNPSSINAHLIKMGYKGILVGHGVRQLYDLWTGHPQVPLRGDPASVVSYHR